jgi:hypothetical protein
MNEMNTVYEVKALESPVSSRDAVRQYGMLCFEAKEIKHVDSELDCPGASSVTLGQLYDLMSLTISICKYVKSFHNNH